MCVLLFSRKLSLREAAKSMNHTHKYTKKSCKCMSGCKSGRCRCRSNNISCSTHCHPMRGRCSNGALTAENVSQLSEIDASIDTSEALITEVEPGVAKPYELFTNLEAANLIISSTTTWLDNRMIDHAQAMLNTQHANISGLHATGSIT